jgi:Protein of unknown function (DUF3551)
MRGLIRAIVGTGLLLAASAAWAQRYDPSYPVCMEQYGADGSVMNCFFTSMEQCRGSSQSMAGICLNNPYYKPPPAEVTPAAEPAPRPHRRR